VSLLDEGRPDERTSTGFAGLDRVLGGGLVAGSVFLIAGEPGIGKSTLLLQAAANLGSAERPALYASGEESIGQVAARARRLGLAADRISFVPGRDLGEVLEAASGAGRQLLVVDSIQSIRDPDQPTLVGGTSQVRGATDGLVGLAKREGVCVIIAGQVTKDGDLAGPRTLEHAVDVVCSFDGDPGSGLRVLTGGKNRFGPEGEVAWFEMGPTGLREVAAPALSSSDGEPGSATALVRAGRRALAVEVQALTATVEGPPRRNVSGLDPRRFGLVAAVVDRTLGLRLGRKELFGAASGGVRVEDPAADLAIAAAIASASTGISPPKGVAFVGEVTLTGSVRPPANIAARLAAAEGAGLERVFCAEGSDQPTASVRLVRVGRVRDALTWAKIASDQGF
jgi:DNA repair protein RadA/Sms